MKTTVYKSAWGWFAILTIAFTVAICLPVALIDFNIVVAIICAICLLLVIIPFTGIYYKITGDRLIVYYCFYPVEYPIDKIAAVTRTKSIESAPAISLSRRIAITFTDRNVMKSTMPLIISPALQKEFIKHLLSINPDISIDPELI